MKDTFSSIFRMIFDCIKEWNVHFAFAYMPRLSFAEPCRRICHSNRNLFTKLRRIPYWMKSSWIMPCKISVRRSPAKYQQMRRYARCSGVRLSFTEDFSRSANNSDYKNGGCKILEYLNELRNFQLLVCRLAPTVAMENDKNFVASKELTKMRRK